MCVPCVYLLRCADGSLYCGWTTDIRRRLAAHGAGTASRYTRSRRPVALAGVISVADRSSFMEMDGRAVYRWATTQLADSAHRACKLAGVDISDIDVFVPHQANLRIVDSMVRTLKLRDDVAVARDIVTSGNTSSASIPLALTAMIERGEVKTGDTALLLGFGAGLTFAGQVIICP